MTIESVFLKMRCVRAFSFVFVGQNNAQSNKSLFQIIPQLSSALPHTLVFVQSYFDFIRVRNLLQEKSIDFETITEYTDPKDVNSSRHRFWLGRFPLLVITERFHFYHRFRLRGVSRIIFYSLPSIPNYYVDFCNMISSSEGSVVSLFSKVDVNQLQFIVGAERTKKMVRGMKSSFLVLNNKTL